MELRTTGGQLKAGAVFRLIATGYIIGAGVIFGPLFLLATLAMSLQHPRMLVAGLIQLLLLPVILGIQSVVVGAAIVLGLWLYQKRRPILVVDGDGALETAMPRVDKQTDPQSD